MRTSARFLRGRKGTFLTETGPHVGESFKAACASWPPGTQSCWLARPAHVPVCPWPAFPPVSPRRPSTSDEITTRGSSLAYFINWRFDPELPAFWVLPVAVALLWVHVTVRLCAFRFLNRPDVPLVRSSRLRTCGPAAVFLVPDGCLSFPDIRDNVCFTSVWGQEASRLAEILSSPRKQHLQKPPSSARSIMEGFPGLGPSPIQSLGFPKVVLLVRLLIQFLFY